MTSSQLKAQSKAQAAPVAEQYAVGPTTIVALPQEVNLTLYQGDDFYLDLFVSNPDNSAADLAGCTASAQIRNSPSSPQILASLSAVINGNAIHLKLDHSDAAKLTQSVWDAQLVYPSGDIVTLVAGTVTVSQEVTRP